MKLYNCDVCGNKVEWKKCIMAGQEEQRGQQYVECDTLPSRTSDLLLFPRTFLCYKCAIEKGFEDKLFA